MEPKFTLGEVLSQTAILAERNAATALAVSVVIVATNVAFDLYVELETLGSWLILMSAMAIVGIAQFMVTRGAMASAGMPISRRKGIGTSFAAALFIISILTGIGYMLLLVPGLYLTARWSIALPLVIGEGERADAAMALSRVRTRDKRFPIFVAQLVASSPWWAGLLLSFYGFPNQDAPTLQSSLVINLLIQLGSLANWYCAVAAHGLLRPQGNDLEDVFA